MSNIELRDPHLVLFLEALFRGDDVPTAYQAAGFADGDPYEYANSGKVLLNLRSNPLPDEQVDPYVKGGLKLVYQKAFEAGDYGAAVEALKVLHEIHAKPSTGLTGSQTGFQSPHTPEMPKRPSVTPLVGGKRH